MIPRALRFGCCVASRVVMRCPFDRWALSQGYSWVLPVLRMRLVAIAAMKKTIRNQA